MKEKIVSLEEEAKGGREGSEKGLMLFIDSVECSVD